MFNIHAEKDLEIKEQKAIIKRLKEERSHLRKANTLLEEKNLEHQHDRIQAGMNFEKIAEIFGCIQSPSLEGLFLIASSLVKRQEFEVFELKKEKSKTTNEKLANANTKIQELMEEKAGLLEALKLAKEMFEEKNNK